MALLSSGAVVFAQFVLFLLIGSMLYVYYTGHATAEMAAFTVGGRIQSDRIFPHFIVTHLPARHRRSRHRRRLRGRDVHALVLAELVVRHGDGRLLHADAPKASDEHYLRVSRWLTAFWGVVQISVALVAIQFSTRAVDEVLGHRVVHQRRHPRRVPPRHLRAARAASASAFAGILAGTAVMLAVKLLELASWQWYVLIGAVVTYAAGVLASRLAGDQPAARP